MTDTTVVNDPMVSGYAIMHAAICQMAGTSGANARWYYDKANEVYDRIKPLHALTAQPSAGAQGEQIGCAEPQVGRAVYPRIEKLMDLNPQPNTSEWTELDYLSDLTNCVEEYGSYDGPTATPAQPDTGDVAALRADLLRKVKAHPILKEKMGGQTYSYLERDAVIAILEGL